MGEPKTIEKLSMAIFRVPKTFNGDGVPQNHKKFNGLFNTIFNRIFKIILKKSMVSSKSLKFAMISTEN